MHVAVCIVSFRNPDDVLTCLEALAKSAYADFEVVICENGGEAAFSALLQRLPSPLSSGQAVTCVRASSNLGYAGGVNLCMNKAADADAWWILNPDTVPAAQALERLCDRLSRGDCGAVGCTLRTAAGGVESRGGRWIPWLARAVSIDFGVRSVAPRANFPEARLSYLSGASMLVGRNLVERVGLMREDYFLYGEEVEWCLRAASQGIRLGLAVGAEVLHHQGTTTGSVSEVARRSRMPVFLDERNKMLITRDHFPRLLPVAAAGALVMMFLRFARRGAWSQLGYALSGWRAGLNNQRGKPGWVEVG
jgi:N-acetylglucosaminyl-diphospho-decaprenol L-rhamnosyltransferase